MAARLQTVKAETLQKPTRKFYLWPSTETRARQLRQRLFKALSALYKQAALVVFMRKIRDLEKNIVMTEHWAAFLPLVLLF